MASPGRPHTYGSARPPGCDTRRGCLNAHAQSGDVRPQTNVGASSDLDKRKADNPAQPAITVAPVVHASNPAKDAVAGSAKPAGPYVSPLKAARKEATRAKKERQLRGPMR
jgi:hypothetical protein